MPHGPEKLSEFLNRLAGSAALQNRYVADRDAVLAQSGLSAAHKSLLKNDKLGPIRKAVHQEMGTQADVICVIKIRVIKAPAKATTKK